MAKKFKCPYTYPHRSRAAMIDYILDNGGYHRVGESWPLAYNVKAYPNLDFSVLWEKHAKEHVPGRVFADPEKLSAYRALAEATYEGCKDKLYDWALESARSSVTDCDTYLMLWNGSAPIPKTELGFCGRSGGYICITRFNWQDFRGWSRSRFEEWLREPESVDMKELRLLYKMCRQWEVDFTPAKAAEEVQYQAAFTLFCNQVEPEWDALEDKIDADRIAAKGPKLTGRRIRIRPAGAV